MHHKPFGGWALPRPAVGAYSAPQIPTWIKGWAPSRGGMMEWVGAVGRGRDKGRGMVKENGNRGGGGEGEKRMRRGMEGSGPPSHPGPGPRAP